MYVIVRSGTRFQTKMFNLDEEMIECALGNKELCFWQGPVYSRRSPVYSRRTVFTVGGAVFTVGGVEFTVGRAVFTYMYICRIYSS